MYVYTYMYTCTCIHTCIHVHMYVYTCMYTRSSADAMPAIRNIDNSAHTHTQRYSLSLSLSLSLTHTHTHMHTYGTGKVGEDTGGNGNVALFNRDATRIREPLDDRQEGIGSKHGCLVRDCVDDLVSAAHGANAWSERECERLGTYRRTRAHGAGSPCQFDKTEAHAKSCVGRRRTPRAEAAESSARAMGTRAELCSTRASAHTKATRPITSCGRGRRQLTMPSHGQAHCTRALHLLFSLSHYPPPIYLPLSHSLTESGLQGACSCDRRARGASAQKRCGLTQGQATSSSQESLLIGLRVRAPEVSRHPPTQRTGTWQQASMARASPRSRLGEVQSEQHPPNPGPPSTQDPLSRARLPSYYTHHSNSF
jgi:hypothetical protein